VIDDLIIIGCNLTITTS